MNKNSVTVGLAQIAPAWLDRVAGTEKIVETLPLERLGQPSEVADVIYFLCSDTSSYVTGTEIEVNGGQHV